MKKSNYWLEFWNNNNIINKPTIHEKVGRTIKGVPIDDKRWATVLTDLETQLELNANDDLLDIAAGSGAIAIPFSKKVKTVTALDISEKLLTDMQNIKEIKTIIADARDVEFENNSFSKIILYFALQHFNENETILMFKKIHKWLKPGGICFIGDIPDSAKIFEFFNDKERETAYFNSIMHDEPIIGTWFNKLFIDKLSSYVGFNQSLIIDQPKEYINAHYRFDVKLIK